MFVVWKSKTASSVSYTHLDVNKRQVFGLLKINTIFGIEKTAMTKLGGIIIFTFIVGENNQQWYTKIEQK